MYEVYKLGVFLLLIYPSSCYSIVQQAPLNPYSSIFLQQNDTESTSSSVTNSTDSDELTSLGTLASGVESLSKDVHELASGLDTSIKQLSSQLDSTISVSAESSVAIINSDIQDKYHELDKTNTLIDKLEAELVQSSGVCGDFVTCDDCTVNSHCIWCISDKQCMSGDESGSFKGECEEYEYDTCTIEGCEQHAECSVCISYSECGWCDDGNYCLSGSPDNTKDCSSEYFYHQNGSQNTCTGEETTKQKNSAVDAYLNYNPTSSYDLDTQDKEQALADLREYAAELELEIEDLEVQKQQILADAEEGVNIEMSTIELGEDLEGLTEEVDGLYKQERQEDRDYLDSLAYNSTERIITETNKSVDEATQVIVEKQDQSTEDILKQMADYSQQAQNDLEVAKKEAKTEQERRDKEEKAEQERKDKEAADSKAAEESAAQESAASLTSTETGETVADGEGEGETEGETAAEGEGETVAEGEGETAAEGEGETEGETTAEGEGETAAEGEGETAAEGEGETAAEGEGETAAEGEGETAAEGEGEATVALELKSIPRLFLSIESQFNY